MNNREVTRLTKKFQTSVPKKIREKKGLEAGNKIAWILNEDGTILLQKIADDSALEEFVGIVKTAKTTEEIMEELRGPRHENGS
jgi:AbrB family looped-hinge helix DNA binding protein